MMDSPDYAVRTVKKLKIFGENKIFPGKNLIITMETAENPPNSRLIEALIKEFLL